MKLNLKYVSSHLEELCEVVVATQGELQITRIDEEDVVLISASSLAGLHETIHLLNSPANAENLASAMAEARSGNLVPMTIAQLAKEVGIEE